VAPDRRRHVGQEPHRRAAQDGSDNILYTSPNLTIGPALEPTTFEVGGRTWRVSPSPAAADSPIQDSWTVRLVFVGGLLTTLLGLGLVHSYLRRSRERAQADDALRRSEAHFRALIENTADVFLVTGRDGLIQYVSPSMQRVLGFAPNSLVRRNIGALVAPAERDQLGHLLHHGQEGQIASLELQIEHADGAPRSIEVVTHQLLNSPAVGGIVLTARDITERKAAERHREALAQGEKLRALGQMASGVAHDLNQSLQLIGGYASLACRAAEETPPDLAGLREMLPIVAQAAHDGGETVRRLLSFSRHQSDVAQERLDLGALLHETARLTSPRWRDAAQAEGRPISLHVETSGELVVLASAAGLREALANLIFNAVDALPQGGTIRLSGERRGDEVQIEVEDSGIGMSRELQGRIFEPFFTTKGNRGTGLGLSQVFGIVEQHSGQLRVVSEPGEGTRITLTLPAAMSVAREPAPAAVEPVRAQEGLRVLVVDDEPAIGAMVRRVARRAGHHVAVATSGEEALQRLTAEPFDVVVSDVGMGAGMNGWDLAEHVTRQWPLVQVVLATGWGAQIDPTEARTKGVAEVLAKPYRPDQLEAVLARLAPAT
jgi:PAS domain S-box-containing protein